MEPNYFLECISKYKLLKEYGVHFLYKTGIITLLETWWPNCLSICVFIITLLYATDLLIRYVVPDLATLAPPVVYVGH